MTSTSACPRVPKSDPAWGERLTITQDHARRERGRLSGVNDKALACASQSDVVAD
jgi:hypothetical protein